MQTELIGDELKGVWKWVDCAMVVGGGGREINDGDGDDEDGCLYAIPSNEKRFLKIDPNQNSIAILLGPELGGGVGKFGGFISAGGCLYGYPFLATEIVRYNPTNGQVTKFGKNLSAKYLSAALGPDGMIYLIPTEKGNKILRFDPVNESISFVGDDLQFQQGWRGAALAKDGCIYVMPCSASYVMRFNPRDETTTFIGDDLGNDEKKWGNVVISSDGNLYGIPFHHHYILKVDVTNQSTYLVGPDLGSRQYKYSGGVLGLDKHIYMTPNSSEYIVRFNPSTGLTSNVGQNLGDEMGKYGRGVLAPKSGYIFVPPFNAMQVLKIKSWNHWLYLKPRLLVEQGRAEERIIHDDDDELNVVQHFITQTNDDIFRVVLEMLVD